MSVVMTGTALAQIIGFALTPVISRLFTSEDFGLFGSFNAVLAVVAAGVTLQYSQAIMLPKKDEDAANVFAISLLSVIAITLACFFITYIFSDWLLGILKAPQSKWLIWFLPVGIGISGMNQSFQAWCVRRKAFKRTAFSQMVRACVVGILQIVTGLFHFGGEGLVSSSVTANGTASLNLAHQVFCRDRSLFRRSLDWVRIRRLAHQYRDFPIYAATQNVMNALSQGLPVLLLGYFYGIAVAGAYAFGIRLLKVPMNFVLTALRQVLFQKASETHNAGGKLLPLYVKLTLGLLAIAFFPAVILFIWAPQIFSVIFGEEWHTAGVYARWIVLWLMIAFCNVPSVLFARILRKQKQLFLYELIQLFFRTASLFIGGLFFQEAYSTVILFSVVGILSNSALILWIGLAIKRVHVT
ncbi:MAG: oligosaccharide flippase family protein [Sedimentisphaerales bacterium]